MIVKIVKIYLGLSLVLFVGIVGSVHFRIVPWSPSYVVGTNYRVLIYCTCHFQGGSLGFSFCLLVSSVSDFRPDTRGRWWTLF